MSIYWNIVDYEATLLLSYFIISCFIILGLWVNDTIKKHNFWSIIIPNTFKIFKY